MKKILMLLVLALSVSLSAQNGVVDDNFRQALLGALDQAKASLKKAPAPFRNKTVAILPIAGDPKFLLSGHLKNILTEIGFTCVEGKEDPMWNEIIKEIAWDERKDDILDPKTLKKFGKLKAAKILLYGKVRALDSNGERIYAEVELHATDLETKQHIWGGNFAARFYPGREVQGIIALDDSLRMLLKKNFAEAERSLASPKLAKKLDHIDSVIVVPFAGDIDQYITNLATDMLTHTKHSPQPPCILSLPQVRMLSREGQAKGDAVFYGAVRDLRRSEPVVEAIPDSKTVRTTVMVYADIQLSLEDLKSGKILWSDTITLKEALCSERAMTADEVAKVRKDKIDAVPDAVKEDLIDNWKHYLAIAGAVVGGLLLVVLIIVGIKAFVSYHHVR